MSTATIYPRVHLKPRKAQPFFGRHPWVLSSAIASTDPQAEPGDIVDLVSDKGQFIARGILNPGSRIRVRLYSWDPQLPLDHQFFYDQLAQAVQLRNRLGLDNPLGAARLVFGEADGLSGLIVDRYADQLVVQYNALAMLSRHELLTQCLVELLKPTGIVYRVEEAICRLEQIPAVSPPHWGTIPEALMRIEEHGLQYHVDLSEGQKTGFYLDQRDNRRVAAFLMRDQDVLDLFCYSGGFGLAAAQAGAKSVIGVDSSHRAIELARQNASHNGLEQVEFVEANVFHYLDQLRSEGRKFGAVILDPPKFAHSRRKLDEALRAYFRINRLAVDVLQPNGILVTCSCTGSVMREDLLMTLSAVSQKSKRPIQVLEQRGPGLDHPVSATCLENDYLKCFICKVG